MANALTAQLTNSQLKANIDALQKGGMKTPDIQSYVNNYKSDGKGGYVLSTAPASGTTTAPAPADPGVAQNLATDTQSHAANIAEDVSEGESAAAAQPNPIKAIVPAAQSGLRVAGEVAGEVGDFFGEPLKAVVGSALTPEAKQGLSTAVQKIAGTPEAQGVIDAWNKLQAQHPDAAKNIGSAVNVASLFGGDAANSAAQPAIDDATGAVKDAITDTTAKIAANSASKVSDAAGQSTWDLVKPNLSTSDMTQAVKDGRITTSGILKTVTQIPKGDDIKMVEAAAPYVTDAKGNALDPITAVSKMQDGIQEKATALSSGLEKTGAIYSKSQIVGALNKIEPPTMIASDATLNRAYGLVKDKMVSLVGNGGKLSDLLDARRGFDQFVAKQFPNLYNSDTLTPMRSAISDIRGSINSVIESRLPDGKLPDGTSFRDSLKQQSLLYDAIDNASPKVGKPGTNVISQFVKAHPTAAKVGAGVIGGGIAGGLLKSATGL